MNCPSGRYQPDNASAACLPCIPGKFKPTASSTECFNCPNGWLQGSSGETFCTKAKNNEIVIGKGSVSVVVPEGSYIYTKDCSDENNEQSCAVSFDQCPAGWMGHKPADTSCTECNEGAFSTQGTPYNKDGCRTCSKGTYSNKKGTGECFKCPKHTYQPQDTNPSTKCIACPTGFTQVAVGESSCIDLGGLKPSDCNDKQYWVPNITNTNKAGCETCPNGASCKGAIDEAGVRTFFGWSKCLNANLTYERCSFGAACLGARYVIFFPFKFYNKSY